MMPQQDMTAWLHRSMLGLPRVAARPDPHGGVEHQVGDIGLVHLHRLGRGQVDLDAGP